MKHMVTATIKGWQEQMVFTLKCIVEKKKWTSLGLYIFLWATLHLAVGGASGMFWEHFEVNKFNDLF